MRQILAGQMLLLLLPTLAWTDEVLIENQSPRPLVYQIRDDAETWGESLSLPKGFRHRYSTSLPLVIRFHNGEGWRTYRLSPGRLYRFQLDAKGSGRLSDVGAVGDVAKPHAPSVPDAAAGGGRLQNASPARPGLELREIKVLCLADESYRRRFPEWKQRIAEIVSRASRDFESVLGLRFTIAECRPWDYEAKNVGDPQEQLTRLVAIPPAPAELVIALVGVIQNTNTNLSGRLYYEQAWTFPFGQHVVVSDIRREQVFGAEQLLVQTLCQVFGAFYVVDRHSIMNRLLDNVEPGPVRFGSVTQQVILLTRDFDFRRGPASLTPEAVAKIRQLYRKYRDTASKPSDDPVTSGFRAREFFRKRLRPEGVRMASIRIAEKVHSKTQAAIQHPCILEQV